MPRTPTGAPPPPPVQRVRLRYAKRGRLRFTSHRDFARAFERALRRAAVPVAYSAGFNPHPRVSYAGAAPTGTASEAEYLEVALAERRNTDELRAGLDAALPAGLDLVEAVEARTPDLGQRLEASVWELRLPGVAVEKAAAAVEELLRRERAEVERLTKSGVRRFDVRAAIVRLTVHTGAAPNAGQPAADAACAILDLVVRHLTPAVRPDDVLTALRRVADLAQPAPPLVTRLAQGPLDPRHGTVADPLAADRAAAAADARPGPAHPAGDADGQAAASVP